MKRTLVALVGAGLLLASLPAAAASPTGTWTAVASTGVVDESAAGIYAFGSPNLGYSASGSVSPIIARYNVTNTWATDTPPWTTLELGYFDNSPLSSVQATLFEVDPCTGAQTALCSVTSVDSSTATCATCQFSASSVDFSTNLYYVQVVVSRSKNTVSPQALTLRIR